MPLLGVLFLPINNLVYYLYALSILFLSFLGGIAAKTGGSNVYRAILRVVFWGSLAMGLTALVGWLFGVNV
jgi:VIT1/CCC1 family predicted Fe2+/Mn2+ transporter